MISDHLAAEIVRLAQAENWPVGTIASQLRVHHSVVTRVLRQNTLGRSPVLPRPSMIDPYIDFVKQTLDVYPDLHASRLYQMVCGRGYKGGPDHFRAIVARYRPRPAAEAYLRLRTLPGEQAQVDWGDFGNCQVEGAVRRLSAFVMTLSYSRALFVRFSYSQAMSAFLRGHVEAFEQFGGVPRSVLYDNLKSAVTSRVGDAIQFHPNLLALATHYRYLPKPVAVARGNEKGRVERSIRYLRTSFFPARQFHDIEHLNSQVRDWISEIAHQRPCPGDTTRKVSDVYSEERSKLLRLPDNPFPHEERATASAGKTPYIRFDCNDYSIPHDRVRRQLTVLATETRVVIVDGNDVIAEHQRCWGKARQVENPNHIADLALAKHRAHHGRTMDRLHHACPSCQQFLQGVADRNGPLHSTIVALGKLLDRAGAEILETALTHAIAQGKLHIGAVRHLVDQEQQRRAMVPPVDLHLSERACALSTPVRPQDLSVYDRLYEGDESNAL